MHLASTAISKGQISDKTASKLADMLMSKDPHEVAAAVQMIEDYATKQAPKKFKATLGEAGTVTGTTSAIYPAPAATEFDMTSPTTDIEQALKDEKPIQGPDIEEALRNRDKVK